MIIYSTVLESFNLPVYQMVLHVLPYFQQPTKEREKKKDRKSYVHVQIIFKNTNHFLKLFT